MTRKILLTLRQASGLKIAMNENFIISADIGKALKEQDGGINSTSD
ncbi:MAG: hypothetical protein U5L72_17950 [Bacteroidales bacterium]|nr:hypothetical protein [Bacteroidales bacterium]